MTGLVDEELVSFFPKSLKFICHNGAGYDQVDAAACAKRGMYYVLHMFIPGIRVSNTPGAVVAATADVGIFLLLGAIRNFNHSILELRRGEDMPNFVLIVGNWKNNVARGHDPEGKIMGILGMGDIGQAMAVRAVALGMKIQYYNRHRLSEEKEKAAGNAKYVGFNELLATSDVLSLNLPLNPKTRHLISRAEFAKMKKGVVIVNTARGAVMDEEALVEALDSGIVASAGLDVYENEPEIHPGLMRNENVLLLPHLGTHTYETQKEMEVLVIDNIRSAVTTGKLLTPVN